MTVSSETAKVEYTGNGITTTFPVPYYFLADAHLKVVILLNNVEIVLVLSTQYTVSGAGNPAGGSVTTITPPAAGAKITIARNVPLTQETDYQPNDPFPAASHEEALDKLTMEVQQLNEELSRTLTLPISAIADTELPMPEPNSVIAWNQAANALENVAFSQIVNTAVAGSAQADIFSGDGSATAFTLTSNPGSQANLDVSISGVTQKPGIDYTWTSGTTITFTTAPPNASNNILVRYTLALPSAGGGTNDSATISNSTGTPVPGAFSRLIASKLGDMRSVLDFAPDTAEADNNYDWTAAIQAAVNSMSGGGTVYFPPRPLWYRIDGTITVSTNGITIDGNNNVLQWYNDAHLFSVTGASFTLRNARIYNNGSTTYSPGSYCIDGGVAAGNLRVDSVTCLDCGSGLRFRSNYFWVSDCEFNSLPQDGYGVYLNCSGPGDGIGFISSSVFGGTGNDFGATGVLTPGQRPNACIFCEDGGAIQIDSCELMQAKYSLLLRPNSTVGAMGSFMCSNTFFDTFDYAGVSYDNAANPTAHFQRNLFSNCWISNGGQTNKSWTSTNATALIAGTSYRIQSVGTSNFTLVGAASNTVGVWFTATGSTTGTGVCAAWEDIPTGEGILIPDNCIVEGLQVNNCEFYGNNYGVFVGNNCGINGMTITDSVFGLSTSLHSANADISIGSNAEFFSIEGNVTGTNGGFFPSTNGVYINSGCVDFLINNNRLYSMTIASSGYFTVAGNVIANAMTLSSCNNYTVTANKITGFTDNGTNNRTANSNLIVSGTGKNNGLGFVTPTNYSPSPTGPGGRLLSTTYTNSKPYPIQVVVTAAPNAAGATDTLQGLIDGNVVVGQGSVGIGAVYGATVSVSLIVPPGSTYQVRGYLGVLTVLALWYEYQ